MVLKRGSWCEEGKGRSRRREGERVGGRGREGDIGRCAVAIYKLYIATCT